VANKEMMKPGYEPRKLTKRFWLVSRIFGFLFGFVLLLLAFVFVVDPVSFRKHVFTPVREISFFANELDLFSIWNQIKKIESSGPQIVHIPGQGEDGIKIVAELRMPDKPGRFPTVLLLHRATRLGRKSGLIRFIWVLFSGIRLDHTGARCYGIW
jgi:hypothetical protein